MAARQADPEPWPAVFPWVAGLTAIALLAAAALRVLHVTTIDAEQQQHLVWGLARGDLAYAMTSPGTLPQTSGPGFGLFAAPLYLPLRALFSPEDGFLAVSYLALVPLGIAAIAASRAVGVAARSRRELLNVAAVVLGLPVLACFVEYFHPADVLATAAVLGAFAALARGRSTWAFLLLGFALVTRQWAVIPLAVLLVLEPRAGRPRLALGTLGTAVVLTLPFVLADPSRSQAALVASDVIRGQLTAPALLPLGEGGLYLLSRVVPLLLVGIWCVWLARKQAAFAPELAVAALAVALLIRPLIDPAGFMYYLAPGYAFAVLLRPQSWRWPVFGLLGGALLWYRRTLRIPWPTTILTDTGRQPQLVGGSLAVLTTLVLTLVALLAVQRTVELLAAPPSVELPEGHEAARSSR